jgi:hypothetical protein
MKKLTKIKKVVKRHIAFGRKLGLDLSSCSIGVALAKIEDEIDKNFWGIELGKPTQKQIELAAEFGYEISGETRRVGSAIINDIMDQLNFEAIENQNLKPGVSVVNKWDRLSMIYIISSIKEDGLVFFKGGNGKRAWARSLIRTD